MGKMKKVDYQIFLNGKWDYLFSSNYSYYIPIKSKIEKMKKDYEKRDGKQFLYNSNVTINLKDLKNYKIKGYVSKVYFD